MPQKTPTTKTNTTKNKIATDKVAANKKYWDVELAKLKVTDMYYNTIQQGIRTMVDIDTLYNYSLITVEEKTERSYEIYKTIVANMAALNKFYK